MRSLIFSAGLLILLCCTAQAQEDPVEDAAEEAGVSPASAIDTVKEISDQLGATAKQFAESLNTAERIEIATQLDILQNQLGNLQGDKIGSVTDLLGFALNGPEIPVTRYADIQSSARRAIDTINTIQLKIANLPQLVRINSGKMQTEIQGLLSYKKGLLAYIVDTNPPFTEASTKELRRVNDEVRSIDLAIGQLMPQIGDFRSAIYDQPIDIRCGPGEEVVVEEPDPTVQSVATWECRKKEENPVLAYVRHNPGAVGSIVAAVALLIGLAIIYIIYRRRRQAT